MYLKGKRGVRKGEIKRGRSEFAISKKETCARGRGKRGK